MTPELTALAIVALIQVVQYGFFDLAANLELGTKKTLSSRDPEMVGGRLEDQLSMKTGRLLRTLNNNFEALIMFTAAVVVVTLSNQSTPFTQTCAWVFVAARVAYGPTYYFDLVPWRSIVWFAGFAANILMLLAVFV